MKVQQLTVDDTTWQPFTPAVAANKIVTPAPPADVHLKVRTIANDPTTEFTVFAGNEWQEVRPGMANFPVSAPLWFLQLVSGTATLKIRLS